MSTPSETAVVLLLLRDARRTMSVCLGTAALFDTNGSLGQLFLSVQSHRPHVATANQHSPNNFTRD